MRNQLIVISFFPHIQLFVICLCLLTDSIHASSWLNGSLPACLNRLFVFISTLYKFIQQGLADCHYAGPVLQVLLPQSKMFAFADFPLLLFLWQRRTSLYYPKLLGFFVVSHNCGFQAYFHIALQGERGNAHIHYISGIIDFIVLHLFGPHFSFIKQFNNKSMSTRWLNTKEKKHVAWCLAFLHQETDEMIL